MNLSYLFIYKFDQLPQLNSSIHLIDGWTIFCHWNLTNDNLYTFFLDNQQTFNHRSFLFGIRELTVNENLEYCSNYFSIKSTLPIVDNISRFTSDYELRIYSSGCYYLNDTNRWQSNGLRVGSLTNHYETECYAKHLTTFASGFIVLPSSIDWNYVFANMNFIQNKTIYFTLITIVILYILLIIYARYKDKRDFEKLGVIVLSDNQESHKYYYQLFVFTGQRPNAGTKSKVHLILSGDNDRTDIRTLTDSHREILHIWHDNSGDDSSASWFLKYIIVRDLQTMEKFYFISQRWFAVEKDDGKIEHILPVASELDIHKFSYILSKKVYHTIYDRHLWFSIFARLPSTGFTRVQRCTCCFVLLFISMLFNIMYYDLSIDAKSSSKTQSNSVTIGSLYITPEQIGIGVMSELLALIPSLLIVQFFRRIRSRQHISSLEKTKKNSRLTFPWWCLFLVYALSFLIVGIAIFFIIVRGIELGDLKTQKWLTSIISAFFSSIFCTQPIKILCLAIFSASLCRKSLSDAKEENEYIDEIEIKPIFVSQSSKQINRLTEDEVARARKERLKNLRMWSIVKEFLGYCIFFVLICLITFSNRDLRSFSQMNHLRKSFLNQRQSNLDYTKVFHFPFLKIENKNVDIHLNRFRQ